MGALSDPEEPALLSITNYLEAAATTGMPLAPEPPAEAAPSVEVALQATTATAATATGTTTLLKRSTRPAIPAPGTTRCATTPLGTIEALRILHMLVAEAFTPSRTAALPPPPSHSSAKKNTFAEQCPTRARAGAPLPRAPRGIQLREHSVQSGPGPRVTGLAQLSPPALQHALEPPQQPPDLVNGQRGAGPVPARTGRVCVCGRHRCVRAPGVCVRRGAGGGWPLPVPTARPPRLGGGQGA